MAKRKQTMQRAARKRKAEQRARAVVRKQQSDEGQAKEGRSRKRRAEAAAE